MRVLSVRYILLVSIILTCTLKRGFELGHLSENIIVAYETNFQDLLQKIGKFSCFKLFLLIGCVPDRNLNSCQDKKSLLKRERKCLREFSFPAIMYFKFASISCFQQTRYEKKLRSASQSEQNAWSEVFSSCENFNPKFKYCFVCIPMTNIIL
jgi:hypothetical protein